MTTITVIDEAKQRLTAFQGVRTSDGQFFEDADKALQHEAQLLLVESVTQMVQGDVNFEHLDPEDLVKFLTKNRDELRRLLA